MISNQILQNTIDTLKEISNLEFSVLDEDGKEVVSTGTMRISFCLRHRHRR